MGYHLRPIVTEGVFGETSKIREELEELEESLEQNNRILALCELADLYGAIEAVAHSLGSNMAEIQAMAAATKRAFEDGSRQPKAAPTFEGRMDEAVQHIAACMRNGHSSGGEHRIDDEWWLKCTLFKPGEPVEAKEVPNPFQKGGRRSGESHCGFDEGRCMNDGG